MNDPAQLPEESWERRGSTYPSYLSRLTQTELLSPEAERSLARLARAGDDAAKKRLIEANMRLVVNIAKHYRNGSIPLEDLIQEGALGLIDAVSRFDPERGFRFSTYATHWIRQTIGRAVDSKSRTIRVPAHVRETCRRIERERARLLIVLGRDPTGAEVASSLGMTAEKMLFALQAATDPVSIDRVLGPEEPSNLVPLASAIPAEDPETQAINNDARETLISILAELTERERRVMRKRLGLDDNEAGRAPYESPEEMKLSRERVRQIEGQAVRKLRAIIKRRKLPEMF